MQQTTMGLKQCVDNFGGHILDRLPINRFGASLFGSLLSVAALSALSLLLTEESLEQRQKPTSPNIAINSLINISPPQTPMSSRVTIHTTASLTPSSLTSPPGLFPSHKLPLTLPLAQIQRSVYDGVLEEHVRQKRAAIAKALAKEKSVGAATNSAEGTITTANAACTTRSAVRSVSKRAAAAAVAVDVEAE